MFSKLYSAALGAASVALLSTAALAAPSQATFTAAGLGAIGGWTLVSPETFGSGGGNGFFAGGGEATFSLRLADHNHILNQTGYANQIKIFTRGFLVLYNNFSLYIVGTNVAGYQGVVTSLNIQPILKSCNKDCP